MPTVPMRVQEARIKPENLAMAYGLMEEERKQQFIPEPEDKGVPIFNQWFQGMGTSSKGDSNYLPETEPSENVEDRRYMTSKNNPFMSASDRYSEKHGYYMSEEQRAFLRATNPNRARQMAAEEKVRRDIEERIRRIKEQVKKGKR